MKRYLIIGGTGFVGRAFAKEVLIKEPSSEVCIFSRSEFNLHNFKVDFSDYASRAGTYIGDVKNLEDVRKCVKAINPTHIVVTAAMKRIEVCEDNPAEAVQVNALGVENVCKAASENNNVKAVIYTSTDKASDPAGVYGHTKAIGESIINSYAKLYLDKKFVTTRFANVLGSTGSVVPIFKKLIALNKDLTLRGENMTRFFLDAQSAVGALLESLNIQSGNILVPVCRSLRIKDLAEIMIKRSNKDLRIKIVAPLPFEKINESLISAKGLKHLISKNDQYCVLDLNTLNTNQEPVILSDESNLLLGQDELEKTLTQKGVIE